MEKHGFLREVNELGSFNVLGPSASLPTGTRSIEEKSSNEEFLSIPGRFKSAVSSSSGIEEESKIKSPLQALNPI